MAVFVSALCFAIVGLGYAYFMTHTKAGQRRAEKFVKPNFMGSVRRTSRLGRPVIQSDEQRSEAILANRDQYDPSIDLFDPRNQNYKGPDAP
jgi:hypothetical protein